MQRTGASSAVQCLIVDGYNEANQGKVDYVEDDDSVDDLLRGFGDLFPGVGCLSCSQTSKLGAGVCECRVDENAAEAMEAVEEARTSVGFLTAESQRTVL